MHINPKYTGISKTLYNLDACKNYDGAMKFYKRWINNLKLNLKFTISGDKPDDKF
jgi:hypothetical protein